MSLTNWNPEREFTTLREAMNRLLEDSFVMSGLDMADGTREARLPVDVHATENDFVVTAAVPGLKPEDVELTYEGDTLTIRGKFPERLENTQYLMAERFHGSFSRTLRLNVPIQADKIDATFDNGILTLVLPKAEAIKPRVIKVKAK
jgi:HSP20 family protein